MQYAVPLGTKYGVGQNFFVFNVECEWENREIYFEKAINLMSSDIMVHSVTLSNDGQFFFLYFAAKLEDSN